jgi:TrmH family RNA methyltransferase
MKPVNVISSSSNSRIKNLVRLMKKSRTRNEQGIFVIEGLKMLNEARASGHLLKVYASEIFYKERSERDPGFFSGLDYEVVADSLFADVSDTVTPQGILATASMPACSLDALLANRQALLLLLEDIRDPGNIGTMIRTAEGAGVTGIFLSPSCVDIYNPKVVRSTMGSIFRVPVCRSGDFYTDLMNMQKTGIKVIAADLSGKNYDEESDFSKSCAILIGNEANGLSERALNLSDAVVRIPMAGRVESLNAAVAAAILMYEAARQRRSK